MEYPMVERQGSSSFRLLKVELQPGQEIYAESGAMASQDVEVGTETSPNGGGIVQALLLRFLGKESFFVNRFFSRSSAARHVYLSQTTPGEIIEKELRNETLFVECGALIARTSGVSPQLVWAGLTSWIAGEGLFRLKFSGTGKVWYGSFGAVVEKEIKGGLIVDSGHLLSYPDTVSLNLKLAGGIFSSFFSGEGFVVHLKGSGKIQLQTRSVKGLAGWLNSRFWG
jgi:uncharacterized protein (TIGR00266 family)